MKKGDRNCAVKDNGKREETSLMLFQDSSIVTILSTSNNDNSLATDNQQSNQYAAQVRQLCEDRQKEHMNNRMAYMIGDDDKTKRKTTYLEP